MSTEPQARATVTEETLAAYLDSLLLEGGEFSPPAAFPLPRSPDPAPAPAATPPAPPAAAAAPRYRLVRMLGLTLAIPEAGIVELIPAVSLTPPAPGDPAWSAGETRWRERRIPVADPAAWLLASGQRAAFPGPPVARVRAALIIAGGRLAIGCESVADSVPVEPAEVNWRQPDPAGRRRPWLAGTVAERGWVVIDPAALAGMLA